MSPRPTWEDLERRLFLSDDAREDLEALGAKRGWALATLLLGLLEGTTNPAGIRRHPTDRSWRLIDLHGYVVSFRLMSRRELLEMGLLDVEALYVSSIRPRGALALELQEALDRAPDD